jgi:hypothetical protein
VFVIGAGASVEFNLCCTAADQAALNHPPVGGVKSLREYQQMLDAHYERVRAEGEQKPPFADSIAGLRDAVGFTARRDDFTWLRVCN